MSNCQVSLVLATGINGQVGLNNDLPWRLPADLKHFKELTQGHAVIMGRKTFESIGKPLPGRQNIVISSRLTYLPGVTIAADLDEALSKVEYGKIGYVIGGVGVWCSAIHQADSAIISLVEYDGEADTRIPPEFFETLRKNLKLNNLQPKDGFTLTEWIKPLTL